MPGCLSQHLLATLAEETDDLAFDSSALDVKSALEGLTNVGTVNVTREDLGGNLYSWLITFTEPAISSYSSDAQVDDENLETASAVLSFPLLYAGGEDDSGFGLGTLGTGAYINATRVERGTLGPLSGEVRNST